MADGVLAYDAIELAKSGKAIMLDVRSTTERASGDPAGRIIHVQFGLERWEGMGTAEDIAEFVARVRGVLRQVRWHGPLLVLCQYGVRSADAARVLRDAGLHASSIVDGYIGNDFGPGLKVWD